jgi:hypothetical protein
VGPVPEPQQRSRPGRQRHFGPAIYLLNDALPWPACYGDVDWDVGSIYLAESESEQRRSCALAAAIVVVADDNNNNNHEFCSLGVTAAGGYLIRTIILPDVTDHARATAAERNLAELVSDWTGGDTLCRPTGSAKGVTLLE